jgi:hypothetical protein
MERVDADLIKAEDTTTVELHYTKCLNSDGTPKHGGVSVNVMHNTEGSTEFTSNGDHPKEYDGYLWSPSGDMGVDGRYADHGEGKGGVMSKRCVRIKVNGTFDDPTIYKVKPGRDGDSC